MCKTIWPSHPFQNQIMDMVKAHITELNAKCNAKPQPYWSAVSDSAMLSEPEYHQWTDCNYWLSLNPRLSKLPAHPTGTTLYEALCLDHADDCAYGVWKDWGAGVSQKYNQMMDCINWLKDINDLECKKSTITRSNSSVSASSYDQLMDSIDSHIAECTLILQDMASAETLDLELMGRLATEGNDLKSWMSNKVSYCIEIACDAGDFPVISGDQLSDVRDWFAAMIKVESEGGYFWNMDDDCESLDSDDGLHYYDGIATGIMKAQQSLVWAICDREKVCPHSIILELESQRNGGFGGWDGKAIDHPF